MNRPTDLKKTLTDSNALYAVAGAGDLAVEKLRNVSVTALPARAVGLALTLTGKAEQTYDELARRGKDVTGRIRRQRSSQDLDRQLRTTTSRAKAARTTARKSAAATRSASKGTATSARKSAATAARATKDAAAKIG